MHGFRIRISEFLVGQKGYVYSPALERNTAGRIMSTITNAYLQKEKTLRHAARSVYLHIISPIR